MTDIATWPAEIWLQHGTGDVVPDFGTLAGVTWQEESMQAGDVRYVRADLAQSRIAMLESEAIELRKRPSAEVLMNTAKHLIAELHQFTKSDDMNLIARGIGNFHAELLMHMVR